MQGIRCRAGFHSSSSGPFSLTFLTKNQDFFSRLLHTPHLGVTDKSGEVLACLVVRLGLAPSSGVFALPVVVVHTRGTSHLTSAPLASPIDTCDTRNPAGRGLVGFSPCKKQPRQYRCPFFRYHFVNRGTPPIAAICRTARIAWALLAKCRLLINRYLCPAARMASISSGET